MSGSSSFKIRELIPEQVIDHLKIHYQRNAEEKKKRNEYFYELREIETSWKINFDHPETYEHLSIKSMLKIWARMKRMKVFRNKNKQYLELIQSQFLDKIVKGATTEEFAEWKISHRKDCSFLATLELKKGRLIDGLWLIDGNICILKDQKINFETYSREEIKWHCVPDKLRLPTKI